MASQVHPPAAPNAKPHLLHRCAAGGARVAAVSLWGGSAGEVVCAALWRAGLLSSSAFWHGKPRGVNPRGAHCTAAAFAPPQSHLLPSALLCPSCSLTCWPARGESPALLLESLFITFFTFCMLLEFEGDTKADRRCRG